MKAVLRSAIRRALSMLALRPAVHVPAPAPALRLEELEPRALPSATVLVAAPDSHLTPMDTSASATYTPAQVRHAYGFDKLAYNGAGQTIAIVDAYDDPRISADLWWFDRTFGLPNPALVKATPQGVPKSDPVWAGEISLDVEWAHVIAPAAKIVLVEAASNSFADLTKAVDYARNYSGVSVVSMSWGGSEFSGETSYDPTFTTPSGHSGVAFVASSGDGGAGAQWPAVSREVLAVGGTSLTLNGAGDYGAESAWSSSGGGRSLYETEPSYQTAVQHSGRRSSPDVSYSADPNVGFYVYDTVRDSNGDTGWFSYGGTSAGAPQWAALIALADQGRAAAGLGPLTQVPAAIYGLPSTDFHDVTSGTNGSPALGGYDLVTGRGSPRADQVIAALVQYGAASSNKNPTTSAKSSTSNTAQAHAAAVPHAGAARGAVDLFFDLHTTRTRRSKDDVDPMIPSV